MVDKMGNAFGFNCVLTERGFVFEETYCGKFPPLSVVQNQGYSRCWMALLVTTVKENAVSVTRLFKNLAHFQTCGFIEAVSKLDEKGDQILTMIFY